MNEPVSEIPALFTPYEVAGIGTVTAHDGDTYVVLTLAGPTKGYKSPSGAPSPELAADEIAQAIANPPAFPLSVPSEVPAWRMHALAEELGLSAQIGLALSSLEGSAKIWASAAWYQGNVIERHSPSVLALAEELGLSSAQLDAMFIQAAAPKV